jgi:multisubunit Na+/H+ antiporter MnhG subunit
VKLILIFAFLMLANPTATHAMIRAATNSGVALWKRNPKS